MCSIDSELQGNSPQHRDLMAQPSAFSTSYVVKGQLSGVISGCKSSSKQFTSEKKGTADLRAAPHHMSAVCPPPL